jgi:putative holliday junction resolvase
MATLTLEVLGATLTGKGALIGLDLGTKTIGIAVSDVERRIATPLTTIKRVKFGVDFAALQEIVQARNVKALILGLPLNMDGSEGPRVQATRAFVRNLLQKADWPIAYVDERLTTAEAERAMIAADVSRKKRAAVIDQAAAAIILQTALDRLAMLQPLPAG